MHQEAPQLVTWQVQSVQLQRTGGEQVLHNLHECQFFKICDTVEIQQLTISYR